MLLFAAAALAEQPRDAPLLDRLGHADPLVREAAQQAAMEMSLSDLETVRAELANQPAPRPPALKPPLKLALRHAHLRRAMDRYFAAVGLAPGLQPDDENDDGPFDPDLDPNGWLDPRLNPPDGTPFLGVGNTSRAFREFALQRRGRFEDLTAGGPGPPGYTVSGLVPGFVASKRLMEGDVVTGIEPSIAEADDADHDADGPDGQAPLPGQRVRVRGFSTLPAVLEKLRAGQSVRLTLLRGGRPMEVTLVLDRRIDTTSDLWDDLHRAALREADATWQEQFEPLFTPPPTPPAPPTLPATRPTTRSQSAPV